MTDAFAAGTRVKDLWAGGGTVSVPTCPACGSAARHLHAADVFDHERERVVDLWSYWRCDDCRSLYPDPRPSPDSIGQAYAGYYTHAIDPSSSPLASVRGSRTRAMSLVNGYLNVRFQAQLMPQSGFGALLFRMVEPLRLKLDYHGRHLFLAPRGGERTVLDIGAGNGEFLSRAGAMGWKARGMDPDPAAVRACVEQGLEAWEGFAGSHVPELEGPFDVVTLRHAIEHVPDPLTDLHHCRRRLRPGGMIWLAWPNPDGMGAGLFGPAWRGLEAPRHLCIPSAGAMADMLREAGFVAPRLLRRGHHARSITRESGRIAARRSGGMNRLREAVPRLAGWFFDMAATFSARGGDELVMVAFAPEAVTDA